MIATPFVWIAPPSCASCSTSTMPFAPERDDRGDAHRLAELDVTCRIHGQPVDDADAEPSVSSETSPRSVSSRMCRSAAPARSRRSRQAISMSSAVTTLPGGVVEARNGRGACDVGPASVQSLVARGARRGERAGERRRLLERRERRREPSGDRRRGASRDRAAARARRDRSRPTRAPRAIAIR